MRLDKITAAAETLQDAMREFMKVKKAQQVSTRTIKDYEHYLEEFLTKSHGSLDFSLLLEDVLEYFEQIPDTSPARHNHHYQYLSSFFNWAVEKNKIPKNPITSQKLHKKKDDGNIKPAAIADIKKLLDSFDKSTFAGFRNYVITLVMVDTGMRTSELRRLVDTDFDLASRQIIITKTVAKTRVKRVVYLSDSTARQVDKLIKVKPAGWCDLIFPTREGKEMTCEGMAREFDRQCQKAGVKITPYQFRHTFATHFVEQGGDVFTLQDLLGHADIKMTRRYTDISETRKKASHANYTPINALQGASRLVKIG